ncbi:MAG: cyclic nucleotide-binding domain-containing protein [Erythrobacter sp.]
MTFFDPEWLVRIATAMLLLAYFIRDELKLRLMIIAATLVFNLYYWLVPDPPLWESVIGGFLMVAVNLYVLFQVMLDRTTFRMNDQEKRLFAAFETLSPGQFRRILKTAEWRRVGDIANIHEVAEFEEHQLTQQGDPCAKLFFIFEGAIRVSKGEYSFRLPHGNFVGEVAFVLDGAATATTIAPQGTHYVEWDADGLRKLGAKHPALGNALNALLTRDLAGKLKDSYRPDDALPI